MEFLKDIYLNIIYKELKGFVYKRVKDKALAEDIIHDVFLKAQKNSNQLKDTQKLSAWIYQITRNTIIDHYRKNSKGIAWQELNWDSDESNFNECAAHHLQGLLPSLPEKYRIPLQLTDVENLSQTELA